MPSLRQLSFLLPFLLAGCNSQAPVPTPKAAAFGIFVGQDLQPLAPVPNPEWSEGFYWVTPPEPNPAFASYRVWATPKNGVCRVIAYSDPFTDEIGADKLLDTYRSLVTTLTTIYGKPIKNDDFASDGTLLMMGMSSRASWNSWPGENLNEELYGFGIGINDSRLTPKVISLQYDFSNTAACKREVEDAKRVEAETDAATKVTNTGL